MKTKAFIFFSLLICNLLPAQNIKLDITPHFLGVRADSLLLSMDVSVEIENMESKNAVRLTPVLTGQERKILLPSILLNGKQKQKLYLRNQILRKKSEHKEENATRYRRKSFPHHRLPNFVARRRLDEPRNSPPSENNHPS